MYKEVNQLEIVANHKYEGFLINTGANCEWQQWTIVKQITSSQTFFLCGYQFHNITLEHFVTCQSGKYTEDSLSIPHRRDIIKFNIQWYYHNENNYVNIEILSDEDELMICMFQRHMVDVIMYDIINYELNSISSGTFGIHDTTNTYSRMTRLSSNRIYFALYNRASSTHEGFLYEYPYCASHPLTIIVNTKTTLFMKNLNISDDTMFYFITSNSVFKYISNSTSIPLLTLVNKDDVMIDLITLTIGSFSYEYYAAKAPEMIFFPIFNTLSKCVITIRLCDSSCKSCEEGTETTCSQCDNEDGFYLSPSTGKCVHTLCDNYNGYYYQNSTAKCILPSNKEISDVQEGIFIVPCHP